MTGKTLGGYNCRNKSAVASVTTCRQKWAALRAEASAKWRAIVDKQNAEMRSIGEL